MNTLPAKNRWLAAIFSFFRPGLGQLYNGDGKKAALLYASTYVVFFALFGLFYFRLFSWPLFLVYLSFFGISSVTIVIWSCRDAFRGATRSHSPLRAKWFTHAGACVLWLVAERFLPPDFRIIREWFYEPFVVPTENMLPTILVGDRFYLDKRLSPNDIRRGTIIAFHPPHAPDVVFVKRVIGLPGDTLEMKDGVVNHVGQGRALLVEKAPAEIVPGYEESEEASLYTEHLAGAAPHSIRLFKKPFAGSRDFGPIQVPPGGLFVMGDNRDNSRDSRAWGLVPIQNVIGTPLFIWFSRHKERLGLELK